MYHMSGLGASASVSVSASAGGSSGSGGSKGGGSSAAPACVTAARKSVASLSCRTIHYDCGAARAPLCPSAPAEPLPGSTQSASFQTRPTGTMTGQSTAAPGSGYSKLPVPAATAQPVVPEVATEEPGVPTWVWIAGGVAVLGGAAYFLKKRAA